MMVLNPKGVPIMIVSGEGHKQTLDLFLTMAYKHYENKLVHEDTIPIVYEDQKIYETPQYVNRTEEKIAAQ